MSSSARNAIAKVAAALGASAFAGAMFVSTAGTAAAEPPPPPPGCSAADLAGIMSGVAASTSAYLHTHPDVNAFFTSLKGQPKEEIRAQVQTYLDANPQVRTELQGLRQPSVDFRERCQ